MMHIQWFPGHMTKALRMMEDSVKIIDSIIYVLDARAINACFNPRFDKIIGNKPILYVLNKCDLVELRDLDLWIKYFKVNKMNVVISNSISNKYVKEIIDNLIESNQELIDRYNDKGVHRAVRAMVIGIPNTGKSTLINSLCKGKKTNTGDKPGVTRGKQWIRIDNRVDLLDTPGTMSPNSDDQDAAQHLAFIGSINDDILDTEEMALELINTLKIKHMNKLVNRYGIDSLYNSSLEIIDAIAKSRGYLLKGSEVDYTRACKVIIDDFRKTRIGKIMLEYPNA